MSRLLSIRIPIFLVLSAVAQIHAEGPTIDPPIRIDSPKGPFAANETTISAGTQSVVAAWNDGRLSEWHVGYGVSLDGGRTWQDQLLFAPDDISTSREGDPFSAFDPRTGYLWIGGLSFEGAGGAFVARKAPDAAIFEPPVTVIQDFSIDKPWMGAGPIPGIPDSTRLYIAYNHGVVRSDDLGETWEGPVFLDFGIDFLPRIDDEGILYIAYRRFFDGDYWLAVSEDGGISFVFYLIAERTVAADSVAGGFRINAYSALAVDSQNDVLYAAFSDVVKIGPAGTDSRLFVTKSTDRGKTWDTPHIVSDGPIASGDSFFPWLEVDAIGRLHLLYYDTRTVNQLDSDLVGFVDAYYAFSDDAGVSWHEYRLTDESFSSENTGLDGTTQFIGDYLGMAVSGFNVIPCYPDGPNGDLDAYTRRISHPAVDNDDDGDTDLQDFDNWIQCMSSSISNTGDDPCTVFDTDRDSDIDLIDYGHFQDTFSGDCGIFVIESPADNDICPGDTTLLTIKTSSQAVQTRWERDGRDINAPNSTTLQLLNTTFDDAGQYRAIVSGECGTAKSEFATLAVRRPNILNNPDPVVACPGDQADFAVSAEGFPPLAYQWRRNGNILLGETNTSLTLSTVGDEDEGDYSCLVTDGCGTLVTSEPATLSVINLQINTHPQGGSFCTGSDITLFVSASGGATQFQWFKDGEAIKGETDFFLQIADATPSDVGDYYVSIANECVTLQSKSATINITACP